MFRTAVFVATSLVFAALNLAQAADPPESSPADLERKLHGFWKGPACGGDWTFAADGTFSAVHYSPGNDQLTGTWELRWNTLPPIWVRTCKTSDNPELVGQTWEVKLIELDDNALGFQYPDKYPAGHVWRYRRAEKPKMP